MKPRVSIINLTMDRYGVTKQCLVESINRIEYPEVEWLVWDNGSTDRRVPDLIESMSPDYFRAYPENIGVAKAKNQLFLRATGDYMMSIDPDIIYPEKWVTNLVSAVQELPNVGILGYDPGIGPGERVPQTINGMDVVVRSACWGGYFFPRELLGEIGYIYEGYGLYAYTTGDFALRVKTTGKDNYYIGKSEHVGSKNRASDTYNEMKAKEKDKHRRIRSRRYRGIPRGTVDPYVPPPEMI